MIKYTRGEHTAYYEIYNDGYYIEFEGNNFQIEQREPLIPLRRLSYEENAIKQIEEQFVLFDIENEPEEQDDIEMLIVDQEYRLTLLELGV